jgi:hypothetical protein
MWSDINGECTASKFCFAPWHPYSDGSIKVCSRSKDVKSKMRRWILWSGVNWQGGLKPKKVQNKGRCVHLQFENDAQPKADIENRRTERRMGVSHMAFFLYVVNILTRTTQSYHSTPPPPSFGNWPPLPALQKMNIPRTEAPFRRSPWWQYCTDTSNSDGGCDNGVSVSFPRRA